MFQARSLQSKKKMASSSKLELSDSDSSIDESKMDIRKIDYSRAEVLFFKRDEDINLVYDQLMEGVVPKILISYESSAYDGIAKIYLKKRKGFQKEGDKLHETIYLFMNKDHYKDGDQKGNIVWLDIDLHKMKRTKLVRVPMIFTTSRVQKFDTKVNFIDCCQPPHILFDVLIKTNFKKLPDADKKRCIAKLRKWGKGYPLDIEEPFTKSGHIFIYFENNYQLLPRTCKDLANMLEDESKFNTKTLLKYLKNTYSSVNKNKYLPLEGVRGQSIKIDMESTKRCWVATKYAFVNDCINLIRFATDENKTSDIYEIYDIECTGDLDVAHAFLFDFNGCKHIEYNDVTVLTKGGLKMSYFDTFVQDEYLYVFIKKVDIIEKNIESIVIKFNMGSFIYETEPIDVHWK